MLPEESVEGVQCPASLGVEQAGRDVEQQVVGAGREEADGTAARQRCLGTGTYPIAGVSSW